MIRNGTRLVGLLAGWLILAGQLSAQTPPVKDDAGMFSAAAVGRASEAIKEIKVAFKKDIRVETFPTPAAKFNNLTPEQKPKYFKDWAESRAKALAIEGIYVFICKDPGHLEVDVDVATLKKAFTAADRDALRDLLLANFKKNEYDNGLDGALALVRARLEKNLGPAVQAPPIKDDAGLFSAAAVGRASEVIKDIKRDFKKDVRVETFPALAAKFNNLTPEQKQKYFDDWAESRAKALATEGVYIFVCKEPGHLEVVVDNATRMKAFTAANRDELVRQLLEGFKAKKFDQALLAALDQIHNTVDKNLKAAAPAPGVRDDGLDKKSAKTVPGPVITSVEPSKEKPISAKSVPGPVITSVEPSQEKAITATATSKDATAPDAGKVEKTGAASPLNSDLGGFKMIWLVWGILILLALWIFIGVVRALFGIGRPRPQPAAAYYGGSAPGPASAPPHAAGAPVNAPAAAGPAPGYAPAPAASGGGGGFVSGLMGGMFGAAAGSYLYNRFAGGSGVGGWAGPSHSAPPAPAPTAGPVVEQSYGGRDPGAAPTAPTGYSSAGGDFGEDKPAGAQSGYASAGGDFGEEKPTEAQGGYAGAGGDFGSSSETEQSASGGDFGDQADEAAPAGGGGDFGAEPNAAVEGSGGDFGVDAADGADSGGGDFSGGGGDSSGGGDFGGGAADVGGSADAGAGASDSAAGGDFS